MQCKRARRASMLDRYLPVSRRARACRWIPSWASRAPADCLWVSTAGHSHPHRCQRLCGPIAMQGRPLCARAIVWMKRPSLAEMWPPRRLCAAADGPLPLPLPTPSAWRAVAGRRAASTTEAVSRQSTASRSTCNNVRICGRILWAANVARSRLRCGAVVLGLSVRC